MWMWSADVVEQNKTVTKRWPLKSNMQLSVVKWKWVLIWVVMKSKCQSWICEPAGASTPLSLPPSPSSSSQVSPVSPSRLWMLMVALFRGHRRTSPQCPNQRTPLASFTLTSLMSWPTWSKWTPSLSAQVGASYLLTDLRWEVRIRQSLVFGILHNNWASEEKIFRN